MRHLASIIIGVLLIISASLGYVYQSQSNELKDAKAGLLQVSNTAIFCLSDIDALETMLHYNLSDEVFRERLNRYSYCAEVPSEASLSLYELTGEKTYWKLHVTGSNLAVYFSSTRNSQNPKGVVAGDIKKLVEISNEFSSIYQTGMMENLTNAEAEGLLSLTQSLS